MLLLLLVSASPTASSCFTYSCPGSFPTFYFQCFGERTRCWKLCRGYKETVTRNRVRHFSFYHPIFLIYTYTSTWCFVCTLFLCTPPVVYLQRSCTSTDNESIVHSLRVSVAHLGKVHEIVKWIRRMNLAYVVAPFILLLCYRGMCYNISTVFLLSFFTRIIFMTYNYIIMTMRSIRNIYWKIKIVKISILWSHFYRHTLSPTPTTTTTTHIRWRLSHY